MLRAALLLALLAAWPSVTTAQTKFYLPSTGTPSVSPAFGSTWTTTTNADRRDMVTTRISSAFTEKDIGAGGTANPEYQLLRQYVSAPLAAQTISGTVKGVVRARETSGAASADLAIYVALCDSTGGNIRVLRSVMSSAGDAGDSNGVAPELNFSAGTNADLQNRRFEETTADDFDIDLTSTAASAGDRLIVEIGYGDQSGSTTRYGIVEFGDNSASDLAEDETSTTQNSPWVQFSATLTFDSGGTPAVPRLLILGIGDLLAQLWHGLWTMAYA